MPIFAALDMRRPIVVYSSFLPVDQGEPEPGAERPMPGRSLCNRRHCDGTMEGLTAMSYDPNETYRRGLESRGLAHIDNALRRRSNVSTLPNILPGSPRSLDGLIALGKGMQQKSLRYKEWADGVAVQLKAYRDREVARLHKIDVLTPVQRSAMLADLMRAKHAELLASDNKRPGGVDDHDIRIRGEIREAARKAEFVAHLFADPVAVLVRETLSDPKAATYHDALRNAGPAEIANALENAAATSDAALWAACHRRLSAMSADDRRQCRIDEREVAGRLAESDAPLRLLSVRSCRSLARKLSLRPRESVAWRFLAT